MSATFPGGYRQLRGETEQKHPMNAPAMGRTGHSLGTSYRSGFTKDAKFCICMQMRTEVPCNYRLLPPDCRSWHAPCNIRQQMHDKGDGSMAHIIDGIAYVTPDEAAEMLATTPMRVLMLLRAKALVGIEVDGGWLVSSDSVACCTAHGTDAKVAKGCATHCTSGGCGCK
jgi:hypothetical protein